MATIKDLNIKIGSLKKTKKITGAMKLIATTRFNKIQSLIKKSERYRLALEEILSTFSPEDIRDSLFLNVAKPSNKALTAAPMKKVLLFTSNRGLCASFNMNVIKMLHSFKASENSHGNPLALVCIGKRGFDAFRKYKDISIENKSEFLEDTSFSKAFSSFADSLLDEYAHAKIHSVTLIYNHFQSVLSQKPQTKVILPFSLKKEKPAASGKVDSSASPLENKAAGRSVFAFEPSPKILLDSLIKRRFRYTLFATLIESLVGEHAARMTAMDNATRNCDDLIDETTLKRNRLRQVAITTELTEIIAGAESA